MRNLVLRGAALAAVLVPLAVSAGPLSVVGANAWVGKVYEYPNPFDPNLDRNASETTFTYSNGWSGSFSPIAVRSCARGGSLAGRVSRAGSGTPGPATYVSMRAPASFDAKTIIVSQGVWPGFAGSQMPFQLKFATGASPNWSAVTPVLSGPGTPGYSDILMTNAEITADHMMIEYPESMLYSGTHYADMNHVLVLSRALRRITNVTCTVSLAVWGSPGYLLDMKDDGNGWSHYGDSNSKWARFSFDKQRKVTGIYVTSFENVWVQYTVYNDASNAVASVVMTNSPSGWALPIGFSEPLVTSNVLFDFGTIPQAALRDVLFFEDTPPHGTMMQLR